jgi:Prophage CP4-57 regulatory protein (AlpA)
VIGKSIAIQAPGRFPMSVRITTHSVGWVEHEVQAWLTGRLAERKPAPTVALRGIRAPD